MSVFNIGIFNGPRYSSFPWEHGNRISMNAGKLNVIGFEYLNAGDKIVTDLASVIRQAPMLAPTLDTYKCDVHAFACRLRSIGNAQRNPWVYEDFFNLNQNIDGSAGLPSIPLGLAISASGLKLGLLSEQLGIPTLDAEFKRYKEHLAENYAWLWDPVTSVKCMTYRRLSNPDVAYAEDMFLVPSTVPVGDPFPSRTHSFENVEYVYTPACLVGVKENFGTTGDYYNPLGFNYLHESNPSMVNSFCHHGFRVGNETYRVVFPLCLIDFIYCRYPKALVSQYLFTDYPNGLFRAKLKPAFDNSIDEDSDPNTDHINFDAYEAINGVNVLDLVYKTYKIDSVTVLAEYDDYLRSEFLNLVPYSAFTGNGPVTMPSSSLDPVWQVPSNYLMRPLQSVAWRMLGVLKAMFPDLPTISGTISGTTYYDVMVPSYPFLAYWKVISDWYINTAISDPDDYFIGHIFDSAFVGTKERPLNGGLTESETYTGTDNFKIGVGIDKHQRIAHYALRQMFELANRYWANDYFTSAFPSPQLGSAVGIPVNGTIVDLRNANALQKLRERLLYAGKRFRDVIYSLFGIHTSSAILAMSEVFGSWSQQINVDSVLQTSEGSKDSPQANYAGVGLGYGSGGSQVSYIAEEPTVILFVASILPRASYFQGVSRKLVRANVYDYAIPQLANVGEQSISLGELYLGGDISVLTNPVFGWTRRNGDFMWSPDEVHGDFRSSLDFWHNARIFGSRPSLSEEFLTVQPAEDNLNRIFAVQSDAVNHFYCHFKFFNAHVVRSLPKHVHYEL